MGMLLDPLADKLLIAAAFVALVQYNPSLVPAWVAVVVIGREFLVSGLRSIAASEGFTIEASELGKFKMLVQIVSVVAVILDHRWKEWPVGPYIFPVHWIAFISIWFMVFLSLVSAFDYFKAFWAKIDRQSVKRRRRSFVAQPAEEERCARNLTFLPKVFRNFPAKRESCCSTLRTGRSTQPSSQRIAARAVHSPLGRAAGSLYHSLLSNRLRGCVGHVFPHASVYRAVAETARAAAFEDNRFYPVNCRRSAGVGNFVKHLVDVEAHPAGRNRGRGPWFVNKLGRKARSVAAAGAA